MKFYVFIAILLLTIPDSKAQKKSDTVIYEFVNLYHDGDTSYVKTFSSNDRVLVRQEYYGRSLDPVSVTISTTDTFIVSNTNWKKVFNGNIQNFLSKEDFDSERQTFENTRSESPPNLRLRYTPVRKIKTGCDTIYVYDLDGLHGEHVYSNDTRVYFSFRLGKVGYISYNTQMLMKPYVNIIEMELRKPSEIKATH